MELPPIVTIALYGLIGLFDIICLGLLAYAVDWWWSPSSINFMLFNTIWTLLVLIYLVAIPRFAAALFVPVAAVALLGVTTLFWFSGSIALGAFLGVGNCYGPCGVYKASQAATAFGFFIFGMFAVLLVFEFLRFLRGTKAAGAGTSGGTQLNTQTGPQPYP